MFFFFKQKTAYDMRISDWSSDVCSSDLPDCAVITAPVDGAEDVGLGASITWNAVPGASGYRVYIGTIAGGSEVVDGEEITGTNFNPPAALEENTIYYVRVIPFNAAGRATGCTEISFTTETLLAKPDCAVITAPSDGAEDRSEEHTSEL